MTVLVLGVGNAWRGDDAAGLEVARRLGQAAPACARIRTHEGDPSGLIAAWREQQHVIVVDAVGSGAAPGTVHRLDPLREPLRSQMFSASTHHLGVAEAVELARALDRLPARLELYGIEAAGFDAGAPLTEAVERAVGQVAAELAQRLAQVGSRRRTTARRSSSEPQTTIGKSASSPSSAGPSGAV